MGSRGHFLSQKFFHGQNLHAIFFSRNFAAEFNFNRDESKKNIIFVVRRTKVVSMTCKVSDWR